MIINHVSFKSYRNIKSASIDLGGGINILYGENANGKTNAVEAIYLFAAGKSFRTSNNRDIINFEDNKCEVRLDFSSRDRQNHMNIALRSDRVKQYSYNGILMEKLSEFIGYFRAVLFTPDHLNLVKGAPELRRHFIDIALSQIKPVYISYLTAYSKLISQRNALIKSIKYQGDTLEKRTELSVWTEKFIQYCAAITRYRGEYISRLRSAAPAYYYGLSGLEKMDLSYKTQIEKYRIMTVEDYRSQELCEQRYREIFEKGVSGEIEHGTTLFGPHRDDMIIEIDDSSSKSIASQGQQRSAVLALKLSESDISKHYHGEYPVLLFDDILSELDKKRQNYILSNLSGRQVIITCCDPNVYSMAPDSRRILVSNGTFSEG